ncbi:MAG: hypothetical protein J5862_02605 [Bacteroidales bacterium]|nr:hypothetical protein [Bacteroidales bacterium]
MSKFFNQIGKRDIGKQKAKQLKAFVEYKIVKQIRQRIQRLGNQEIEPSLGLRIALCVSCEIATQSCIVKLEIISTGKAHFEKREQRDEQRHKKQSRDDNLFKTRIRFGQVFHFLIV